MGQYLLDAWLASRHKHVYKLLYIKGYINMYIKREKQVRVNLSEEEVKRLKYLAERSKMSVSEWIREKIKRGTIYERT